MASEPLAFHEAGHAWVADRLGFLVKRASIEPSDNRAGEVLWFAKDASPKDEILVALAGCAAECVFRGVSLQELPGSEIDFEQAKRHARRFQDPGLAIAELGREVSQLLRENWASVESLARSLITERTLELRKLWLALYRAGGMR